MCCRFLLCNHTTLAPAQRVPYRQLSIPAASSSGEGSVGDGGTGRRDTVSSGEGEPMVAETANSRPKMTKVISSEEEVARLTIEVCHFLSLSLTHIHSLSHTHTLSLSHTYTLSLTHTLSLSHTHSLSFSLSHTHTHSLSLSLSLSDNECG